MIFIKFIKNCCKITTILIKTTFLCIFLLTVSCSIFEKKEKKDEIEKEESFEPNVFKRSEKHVQNKGSIFSGGKGGVFSSGKGTNIGIASSENVIWRASIEALSEIPLIQANYGSGLIITDWYSSDNNAESIKINIIFNSSSISAASFKVNSFKKICISENSCKTNKLPDSFNEQVKSKIIEIAKKLSIERAKSK